MAPFATRHSPLLPIQNVVNYFSMGQEIGLTRGIPYISCDLRKSWTPLRDFLKVVASPHAFSAHPAPLSLPLENRSPDNEEFKFLEFQLSLFSALAQGRNELATALIVDGTDVPLENGEYEPVYSPEVAMHILENADMPDQLRAVAAENLRDLCVNTHLNHSIMDRIHLVFAYDEVPASLLSSPRLPTPTPLSLSLSHISLSLAGDPIITCKVATAHPKIGLRCVSLAGSFHNASRHTLVSFHTAAHFHSPSCV